MDEREQEQERRYEHKYERDPMFEGWDWDNILKWIMVLPAFLIVFIFLRLFISIPVKGLVIVEIAGRNLQMWFALEHLYNDLICVAAAVYFSCLLAPKFRISISLIYMLLIFARIPNQLSIVQSDGMYGGDHPWKIPYLITLYILSGLIPFLLLLRQWIKQAKADDARADASYYGKR